jgi:hypothetical protein
MGEVELVTQGLPFQPECRFPPRKKVGGAFTEVLRASQRAENSEQALLSQHDLELSEGSQEGSPPFLLPAPHP